jgi:hypothetical protein
MNVISSDVKHHGKPCDVILGCDLMSHLGIVLDFQEQIIELGGLQLSMTLVGKENTYEEMYMVATPVVFQAADCEEYVLADLIPKHLNSEEQKELLNTLESFHDVFQEKVGLLPSQGLKIQIKANAPLFYQKPYQVAKANIDQMKKEANKLA